MRPTISDLFTKLATLSPEQIETMLRRWPEIMVLLKQRVARPCFTPIHDWEVSDRFDSLVRKYRSLARELEVLDTVAVFYHVPAGFTLIKSAPLAGPCYKNFEHFKSWGIEDEPTEEGLMFFIPRVIPETVGKNLDRQQAILDRLRNDMRLSADHMVIGKANYLTGAILAHYAATGECILQDAWVRTSTPYRKNCTVY